MLKRDMIKKLVCEYAKSFGIWSSGWEYVFVHQDSIVNRIDRNWYKEMINMKYEAFINGKENIYNIMQLLMM